VGIAITRRASVVDARVIIALNVEKSRLETKPKETQKKKKTEQKKEKDSYYGDFS
jgi:hypothetical protein